MGKRTIEKADLAKAYEGSWYFVAGCGGDLIEWVGGYEEMLEEQRIGKPTGWFQTTGKDVNAYAQRAGLVDDPYPVDTTCLLFPLDGLNVGILAMFRLRMQDRWFDDVIDNMRN